MTTTFSSLRTMRPAGLSALALLGCCVTSGCQTPGFSSAAADKETAAQAVSASEDAGLPKPTNTAASNSPLSLGSAEEHLRLGEEALARGKYQQAQMHFDHVLEKHPNHAKAHHRLGVLADKLSQFAQAEEHYLTALNQDAGNAALLSDLGYSYFMQGRYADAERYLLEARKVDPDYETAVANLGLLYGTTGRKQDALAMFRKIGDEDQVQEIMQQFDLDTPVQQAANAQPVAQTSAVTMQTSVAQAAVAPQHLSEGACDFAAELRKVREELRRAEEQFARQQQDGPSEPCSADVTPPPAWAQQPTSQPPAYQHQPSQALAAQSGTQPAGEVDNTQQPIITPGAAGSAASSVPAQLIPAVAQTVGSTPMPSVSAASGSPAPNPHSAWGQQYAATVQQPAQPSPAAPTGAIQPVGGEQPTTEHPLVEHAHHTQQAHQQPTIALTGESNAGPITSAPNSPWSHRQPTNTPQRTPTPSSYEQARRQAALVGLNAGPGQVFPYIRETQQAATQSATALQSDNYAAQPPYGYAEAPLPQITPGTQPPPADSQASASPYYTAPAPGPQQHQQPAPPSEHATRSWGQLSQPESQGMTPQPAAAQPTQASEPVPTPAQVTPVHYQRTGATQASGQLMNAGYQAPTTGAPSQTFTSNAQQATPQPYSYRQPAPGNVASQPPTAQGQANQPAPAPRPYTGPAIVPGTR